MRIPFCGPYGEMHEGRRRLNRAGRVWLAEWLAGNTPLGLFRTVHPGIYDSLVRLLGRDDATASLMVAVTTAAICYDPTRATFNTHVVMVLRSNALHAIARHKARPWHPLEDEWTAPETHPPVEVSTPACRPLADALVAGHTMRSAGESLGINRDALRVRVAQLRKEFAPCTA